MASEKDAWFLVDRSEALAGLLLTSRNDLEVHNEKKKDTGVDFLVSVKEGDAPSTQYFVVQVKGTTSSDKSDWLKGVKEIFESSSMFYLPACVFVVNVKDNNAVYSWVAEPTIVDQGVKLQFQSPGEFHDLDAAAVDDIVGRVKSWYAAMPREVVPQPS